MAKKTNWKTTDKRFVAFLDILGFKEKVLRKTHDEIYNELSKISSMKKKIEETIEEGDLDDTFIDSDIYIVSFSDSIVIFSKHDSIDNFKLFTLTVKNLISIAITSNIAIKGGIAYGEVSLNKSEQIYFGQPIIDAYSIEEDVNFIGVVCHYTIDKYINEVGKSEYINRSYKFVDALLKSGNIKHYILDFHYHMIDKNDRTKESEDKLDILITKFEKFYQTVSGSPRRYIDNSIKFVKMLYAEEKLTITKSKFN